eukprot:1161868-Pelagomonas_calceolata.AAC.3
MTRVCCDESVLQWRLRGENWSDVDAAGLSNKWVGLNWDVKSLFWLCRSLGMTFPFLLFMHSIR